jgi:hypothetical protein
MINLKGLEVDHSVTVSRKKSAQACDELIDEGAIITGE